MFSSLFLSGGPVVHRSDYTYRGRYHYHYQSPRIPPPVVYHPIPLSPPVTYHRPPVPMSPFHHTFKGPGVPHMHHIHKALSPPLVRHPQHGIKDPFPHKMKGLCPSPVVRPPTQPEPTILPTLPASTVAPVTAVPPGKTTAPVTLPVSTQSGFITTVSPVPTGRILPVRFAFQTNQCSSLFFRSDILVHFHQ